MFRRQGRPSATAYLLALALAAAAMLVFFLDDIIRSRQKTYEIVGLFPELDGIDKGSEVRVAGRAAGRVAGVEILPPDHDSIPVYAVRIELPTAVRALVRRDSEIRIFTTGPFGTPAVGIVPGTAAAPGLEPGDTLRARPRPRIATLLAEARATVAAVDALRSQAALLGARIDAVAPDLRRLAAEARGARDEFDAFTRNVDEGPLAAFLADSAGLRILDRIGGAAARIAEAAHELTHGDLAAAASAERAPISPALRRLALRADTLGARIAELRALLEQTPGASDRWERDRAIRDALAATRAQLDSLIAETRRRPWRFFF